MGGLILLIFAELAEDTFRQKDLIHLDRFDIKTNLAYKEYYN